MSGGAPASSSHPPPPPPSSAPSSSGPIPPPVRRHLAFVSMKPPFVAPDDYHRFSTSPAGSKAADRGAEAIVVRSPPGFHFEICRVGEKWDQLKRLECKLTFLADVLTDEFKVAGCGCQ